MIATIAVIAAIVEKKNFSDLSDHMKPLQRPQRQQSLRYNTAMVGGFWTPKIGFLNAPNRIYLNSKYPSNHLRRHKKIKITEQNSPTYALT